MSIKIANHWPRLRFLGFSGASLTQNRSVDASIIMAVRTKISLVSHGVPPT